MCNFLEKAERFPRNGRNFVTGPGLMENIKRWNVKFPFANAFA